MSFKDLYAGQADSGTTTKPAEICRRYLTQKNHLWRYCHTATFFWVIVLWFYTLVVWQIFIPLQPQQKKRLLFSRRLANFDIAKQTIKLIARWKLWYMFVISSEEI